MSKPIMGFAWYYREQWDRLRSLSEDRDSMAQSYDDWERKALEKFEEARRNGAEPHKVYVDVDMLVSWCAKRSLNINGHTRNDFTNHLLAKSFGCNADIT